jgi:hypothetical protein
MRASVITLSVLAIIEVHAHAPDVKPSDLSEIVVADEIRPAFYERAPSKMVIAISKAVSLWCGSSERSRFVNKSEANANTAQWLCGSAKIHYFHNVYITGAKGVHGLVCRDEYKYVGIDMVNDSIKDGSCVVADTEEKNLYRLYLGDVNTGDEP